MFLLHLFPWMTLTIVHADCVYFRKTEVISFVAARLGPSAFYSFLCSTISQAAEEILVTQPLLSIIL